VRALLYTSDPYEPSGVIGLFETEEQKQAILQGYVAYMRREFSWYADRPDTDITWELREIEIPIGVYGEYY
jgi:hypothetical protein